MAQMRDAASYVGSGGALSQTSYGFPVMLSQEAAGLMPLALPTGPAAGAAAAAGSGSGSGSGSSKDKGGKGYAQALRSVPVLGVLRLTGGRVASGTM